MGGFIRAQATPTSARVNQSGLDRISRLNKIHGSFFVCKLGHRLAALLAFERAARRSFLGLVRVASRQTHARAYSLPSAITGGLIESIILRETTINPLRKLLRAYNNVNIMADITPLKDESDVGNDPGEVDPHSDNYRYM